VHKSDGNYTLGASVLSSCDVSDPLWKMVFERSEYDSAAHRIQLYDAKMYMWDVPVFYTPYFSFTTNKERSSGLLFPAFGYSSKEGLLYEQPIFWAISHSMDMEFNPQIRTSRSLGMYSTFRFVDSAYSQGEMRLGYFKDKRSYAQKYDLPEDSHYGFEFNYESSKVFKDSLPEGFTDGLYINTTYLNDIDYLNLQQSKLTHFGQSPLQESRVNYFAHNNDYYGGLYAKYFIDTRKKDNDDTMQILPTVQLHKYLDHFIWDNLTYSADLHLNNFDRKKGATMKQAEFTVPLEFTTAFFDDLLNVSLGEEFYYSKFFFGNGIFVHDDFEYYSNIHKVKLFTDLTKKYEGFIHVLQPSVQYVKPGNEHQSPTDFSLLSDEQRALFSVGLPEEQYDFSLSQYFYDENMKLKFYQRLTQRYYVDREYQFADINNEMEYKWKHISLYSNLTYSYEFKDIREASTYFFLKESDYKFSIGHSFKRLLTEDQSSILVNDVNVNFGYTYNEQIKFDGGVTYNIDDSTSKQWRIGGSYYRDCWSVAASVRQDIRPTSAGAVSENTFYLQLNFTPFGSIGTDTLR
jgi:LPS-assembly protein